MKTQILFPLICILSITLSLQIKEDRLSIVIHATTTTVAHWQQHYHRHDGRGDIPNWLQEPFVNRWQRKFYANSTARGQSGGEGYYLFFKHIRKAGGTTLRNYLNQVLNYHNNPRTAADFIHSVPKEEIDDKFLLQLQRFPSVGAEDFQLMQETILLLNSTNATTTVPKSKNDIDRKQHAVTIHYAEQEFSAMDWECRRLDPRWENTLSVILLRHPIERHLSEFFYSGPGSKMTLDTTKLYSNTQYRRGLRKMLQNELPTWLNDTHGDKRTMNWYLGRYYTDNFQLRALGGCASGACLDSKNLTVQEDMLIKQGMQMYFNVTSSSHNGACTMYFNSKVKIMDPCRFRDRSSKMRNLCPNDCDTPCRYPVSAWGKVDRTDLDRAISALNGYDVVFLTETLDDDDQSSFLADVMGVPRNATFSLRKKNTNTPKSSEREKTHFYRDLLMNLTLDELSLRIHQENELEIELFEYAVELNRMMVERWKEESG
ncbi:hypothetical protein HJC23_001258 [Cyclotella cryptica]|uniref:Sulfotransferase n=1 Tax=Cyclotella cryptica TaxID=29204 RepID=A0ABD3PET8_9STRA|eukprot:CCRYP_015403-RC/>CCRYP_015403-RC protein AED:0.05 eAED:0.05 QI:127/1/1/1/0.5/0.33/3/1068/486